VACFTFLADDTAAVVVVQLLELVTFRPPEELGAASVTDLSVSTTQARRRASQTFIYICNEIPDALLPHLESILNMIGQIYAQGLLLEEEKANLIEALVAVRYLLRLALPPYVQ
jgi:hypothetical protein